MQKVVKAIDQTTSKVVEINFSTKNEDILNYLVKIISDINEANAGNPKKNLFIF